MHCARKLYSFKLNATVMANLYWSFVKCVLCVRHSSRLWINKETFWFAIIFFRCLRVCSFAMHWLCDLRSTQQTSPDGGRGVWQIYLINFIFLLFHVSCIAWACLPYWSRTSTRVTFVSSKRDRYEIHNVWSFIVWFIWSVCINLCAQVCSFFAVN